MIGLLAGLLAGLLVLVVQVIWRFPLLDRLTSTDLLIEHFPVHLFVRLVRLGIQFVDVLRVKLELARTTASWLSSILVSLKERHKIQ